MSDSNKWDTIVIGGGIMGSWTAVQLLRAGVEKVLLLEKFPLPHTRGSSHGATRICRFGYPQDHQTILARDSLQDWFWLQQESGQQIIRETPLLWTADAKNEHEMTHALANIKNLCPQARVRVFEDPAVTSISQEFPQLTFPSEICASAMLDNSAYVLMADKITSLLRTWICQHGGVIKDGMEVQGIQVDGNEDVAVETQGQSQKFHAKTLVICAGAWAKPFLEMAGVGTLPLQPVKIQVAYFQEKPGQKHPHLSQIHESSKYNCNWSIPSIEYPGLVKFGPHQGPAINPDARDAVDAEGELKKLREFVAETCQALDPTPKIVETCMYTAPDSNWDLLSEKSWPLGLKEEKFLTNCQPCLLQDLHNLSSKQLAEKFRSMWYLSEYVHIETCKKNTTSRAMLKDEIPPV
ncbi:unnamed protein product [Notodromas monacha]|uniref:FAD dependent oxidoreductase domain-containing protein n=1 Tax=Notodromas monacha TaxID=399045 RepID=A0A7R9BIB3_9CRUS|nr:unnamed protein product [Notodromas monacha]CAG0916024.1 unnamed protein product [Notodromas monacha]